MNRARTAIAALSIALALPLAACSTEIQPAPSQTMSQQRAQAWYLFALREQGLIPERISEQQAIEQAQTIDTSAAELSASYDITAEMAIIWEQAIRTYQGDDQ